MKKIIENIRKFFGNKAVKRTLKYTGNVIIALLIVLVGLSVYGNIQSKGRTWVVPRVGSYSWLTVLSGSMKPAFNPGDLIIDKKVDVNSLKVGDIVTYKMEPFITTHRITEIAKDSKGRLFFKTKGDNNNAADNGVIPSDQIIAKYSFKIPFLGYVLQALKGLPGIIGIWVLFLCVIGSEIYRNVKLSRQQKKDETIAR